MLSNSAVDVVLCPLWPWTGRPEDTTTTSRSRDLPVPVAVAAQACPARVDVVQEGGRDKERTASACKVLPCCLPLSTTIVLYVTYVGRRLSAYVQVQQHLRSTSM